MIERRCLMLKSGKGCKLMMVCLCVVILSLSGYGVAAPLHEAAKEGDLIKVNRLIQEGADVNVRSKTGATPLHGAARTGHKDVAELLISKGANVNAKTRGGYTPLAVAGMPLSSVTPVIKKGRKDVIELLRRHGAHE